MQIYSNAFLSKQTGDLSGYELAISHNGSNVDALLYVYEGAPNKDGIHISGQLLGKQLSVEGEWIEHLIEYPSKKEVVQRHHVNVSGSLDSGSFRGKITIEDLGEPSVVRLKRAGHIWLCKSHAQQ